MAKTNALTRSKKLKAAQCYQSRQFQEADRLYQSICQIDPSDAQAWATRGAIQRELGAFSEAEKFCRRALQLAPTLGAAHQELGHALECQGRRLEALTCYRKAAQLRPDIPESYYYLANSSRDVGDLALAIESYRTAVRLRPDFVEALSNLAATLTTMGELQEAAYLLNRAYNLRPNAPQILCNLGELFALERCYDDAIAKYTQALTLDPNFLDAIVKLADVLEKTNRLDQARVMAQRGLTLSPYHPILAYVMANLDRRDGRLTEAAHRLETCIQENKDSLDLSMVHTLLGQVYDRLNKPELAFDHLNQGNALAAKSALIAGRKLPSYADHVKRMRSYLDPALAQSAQSCVSDAQIHSPIFLLGFMRSGTTLLEQMLDSHPQLQSIEEKPTIDTVVRTFEEMTRGREYALATLAESEVEILRQVYFREVARHVDLQPGNILVDKMPLNTANAHLIWRLFPQSKFILALRHPCDVCLSCFMQNFKINEATAHFLNLEEGVKIYVTVMQLWQQITRILPLNYHRIRYEDLIADFEGETRALLNFLGLEWRDEVLGYADHARKRGTVSTASYHQVTQPIYQHAKYRWKRYEKQLAPIIPTLQPFIEYFGYTE